LTVAILKKLSESTQQLQEENSAAQREGYSEDHARRVFERIVGFVEQQEDNQEHIWHDEFKPLLCADLIFVLSETCLDSSTSLSAL
jgi:hypothetical protein